MSAPRLPIDYLAERREDDHTGVLFEDKKWTWREFVKESDARAHWLLENKPQDGPFHIGVMLENVPEFLFLIAAAAQTGATIVGINTTRRGEELARDIRETDVQIVVTDSTQVHLLDGLDVGTNTITLIDGNEYKTSIDRFRGRPAPCIPAAHDPNFILLLLFTSGSTGRPKAVICTSKRFAKTIDLNHLGLTRSDVGYNSMPLFHGNALFANWAPFWKTGGAFAMSRRFSASGFLPDVLKFGATYLNYVGRSLSYILAQPEDPREKQTHLRLAYGTEASPADRREFLRRYGAKTSESYGSSEGGLVLYPDEETPPDALGLPPAGMDAVVLDPATHQECPRADFDDHGRLLNAFEAIGELVTLNGAEAFEGYYKNLAATNERMQNGHFFTGDLGYRDREGYFYFAGRGGDKIRVDSENFSAAPVERILSRYQDVEMAAVYPVPDAQTGDQVMATLQVDDPDLFNPTTFSEFLKAQKDLGTKWAPKYVRVVSDIPVTATRKIDKPSLRRDRWNTSDTVYYRPTSSIEYRIFDHKERDLIHAQLKENQRLNL